MEYREPIVKNNDLLWKIRIEPLDDKKHLKLEVENIMEKFSKTKRDILENLSNRENGYLLLYKTREMNPLFNEKSKLLKETGILLFDISYNPDQINSKEDHLDKIECNINKMRLLHRELLAVYMKQFKKRYWFTRLVDNIKNKKQTKS